MSPQEIRNILEECNPDALFADGFDDALIGIGRRCGQPDLAIYDVGRIIEILMDGEGADGENEMSEEDAWEYYEFNIVGGWHGPNTPIFMQR
jgi:hypothetical protein